MSSVIETALPPTETGLKKIIKIIERVLSPQAEKACLAELSRERIERLVSQFPEDEVVLRQDLLRRFEKMNGTELPNNLSWLKIQDLFEAVFKVYGDKVARKILSEGLNLSDESLTEIMKCVGRGQQFQTKKEAKTINHD